MSVRGAVRSSARLSAEAAASSAPAASSVGPAERDAAALRRARAAERAREVEDSPRVLRDKCRRLARALANAKHLVVYTGAGVSTAAAIPDYRGPQGVWTRLARGERVARVEVARATPTYTHMALAALWARGTLKFLVSQNCDGLHARAGLPRRALAELHGDMFLELCAPCRRVYVRAFDTTERTARHRHATRRLCHACGAELRDSIVHFGERGRAAWPLNWAGALRHAARADVVLCLGSSLKVLRRYPRLWRMERAPHDRPQLYIVNLQWTPKDATAALKINARCDAVMAQLARRLHLRVPRYCPTRDPLLAHAEPLAPPEAHTTRRAPLAAPASPASSPSASDSDEELPLRRLADRLRAPPPPPAPLPPPAPRSLRAFHVNLQSGDAAILLRAEHAPSTPPPAPLPTPHPAPPPAPSTAALRRFRMVRPRALNGCAASADTPPPFRLAPPDLVAESLDATKVVHANGFAGLGSKLRCLLEFKPQLSGNEGVKLTPNGEHPDSLVKIEPKRELKREPKKEPKEEIRSSASSSDEEAGARAAGSLAAAIIRRAVMLCRASLYPGLHSMIGPGAAAGAVGAAGECAWCVRRYGARRCLWYGPPRLTPLARRAWRRVRGRRYLCACCPRDQDSRAASPVPTDDAGWYGKGYRKGRRRR